MTNDDTPNSGHDHTTAAPNEQRLHWYDTTQAPADASGQWAWQWDDIAPPELLDEWARTGAEVDQYLADTAPSLASDCAAASVHTAGDAVDVLD